MGRNKIDADKRRVAFSTKVEPTTKTKLESLAKEHETSIGRLIDAAVQACREESIELDIYIRRPKRWFVNRALEQAKKAGQIPNN